MYGNFGGDMNNLMYQRRLAWGGTQEEKEVQGVETATSAKPTRP